MHLLRVSSRWVLFVIGLVVTTTRLAHAAPADEVKAATQAWADALNARSIERTTALYAPDAVFWGTTSQTLRDSPAAIREYFGNMPTTPQTRVAFGESRIRVYADIAVHTGYYTFSGVRDGQPTTTPARFSFTFAKRAGRWLIVDHHSSAIPPPRP